MSCTSATACTAVGFSENPTTNSAQDLAGFWDGRTLFAVRPRWTIQPTQAPFSRIDHMLNAVSCSSATDCLAVGRYLSHFGSSYRNATWAEHWNGTSWPGVLPDVASSYNNLLGVSCTSATACTAVGYYQDSSGMNFPLAESWNGAGWALQSPEFPASSGGTLLWGVSCASATACTAVGETDPPAPPGPCPQVVTLAESWDGTSWTLGSTPNPHSRRKAISYGVSCPSAAVCTAVGFWDSTGGFPVFTLAERFS